MDRKTMPTHFGEFVGSGNMSPGMFLVRRDAKIVEVVETLILVWAASEAEEWQNRLVMIPEH
jgi:hypothetical protein